MCFSRLPEPASPDLLGGFYHLYFFIRGSLLFLDRSSAARALSEQWRSVEPIRFYGRLAAHAGNESISLGRSSRLLLASPAGLTLAFTHLRPILRIFHLTNYIGILLI